MNIEDFCMLDCEGNLKRTVKSFMLAIYNAEIWCLLNKDGKRRKISIDCLCNWHILFVGELTRYFVNINN
jgi:hypothetical protein